MIKFTNILILILIIVVSIKIKNNLIIMEKYRAETGQGVGETSNDDSTATMGTLAKGVISTSNQIQELNNEVDNRNTQIANINTNITSEITRANNILTESNNALANFASSL